MTDYICENCRYRFKSSRDFRNLVCPYCGEKHVKEEDSITDILNSVDE